MMLKKYIIITYQSFFKLIILKTIQKAMSVIVILLGVLYYVEGGFGMSNGMPPFIVLSPPRFRAGQSVSIVFLLQ